MQPPDQARRFHPSPGSSLAMGGLALCFLWLGNWQMDRAAQKAALQTQFEAAPRFSVLPEASESSRFARVELMGNFDPARHLLIDNQVLDGRAGVHVLTPFRLADGRVILINRGWLALAADRRTLPVVPTPEEFTPVSGRLDQLYQPGRQVGEADRLRPDSWPQLVTYPRLVDIELALGAPLYPQVLLLDREHQAGFLGRDWKPVNTGAAKHRARALQWFTFVIAAVVIWVYLGLRRGAEK